MSDARSHDQWPRLNAFKQSSAITILLTSAWLVVVDNGRYWHAIAEVSSSWDKPNPWFLVSIFIVSLTLVNLALTLLIYGRITRYLLALFLCVSASASYFMSQYGVLLDVDMLLNILETDQSEAAELVNPRLLLHIAVFGVLPAILVWRLVPGRQSTRGILVEKLTVLGLSLLVVAVAVTPFYKDYASLVRNHREIRHLLTPINYLRGAYEIAVDGLATPAVAVSLGEDASRGARWASVSLPTLTVLVIGETARADNFSLGAYSRNTNPRLADKKVIYFENVSSCGTATRVSLPCMFSNLNRSDYSKAAVKYREGLLDVLQHAGVRTLWLDNNAGCKGVCRNVPTRQLSESAVSGRCVDGECFDDVLLDELREEIRGVEEDTVIVLHPNGSHGPGYHRRYPDEFREFEPECMSDDFSDCTREQIVNSYDNTILYTDYLLDQVIEILDSHATTLDTAMLYVSDHGESLGEYGLYLHGAPYFIAPDTQTHVPMILWMSSGYQQEFQVNAACMRDRRTREISHDNLFHSMLGLENISTSAYDSELDIFSACTGSPMLAEINVAAASKP